MAAPRDAHVAQFRYFSPDTPRSEGGVVEFGTAPGLDLQLLVRGPLASTYEYSEALTRPYEMTFLDARSHNGGLSSWSLDDHGFTFLPAPEPVDFGDPALVLAEYQPRVLEAAKRRTGASRVFWMGHARRTEEGAQYSRVAHSDYGPDFEPLFRRALVASCGVPEEEASTCGICVANLWAPIERPAYKDPVCFLDGSTVQVEKETIPFTSRRAVSKEFKERFPWEGAGAAERRKRPPAQRFPNPSVDAPALGAMYAPQHRWVYCPDMLPEEAVIFKHYDFRPQVPARATFHTSLPDHFHDAWKECPGRRSIECRLLLTFDDEGKSARAAASKL